MSSDELPMSGLYVVAGNLNSGSLNFIASSVIHSATSLTPPLFLSREPSKTLAEPVGLCKDHLWSLASRCDGLVQPPVKALL